MIFTLSLIFVYGPKLCFYQVTSKKMLLTLLLAFATTSYGHWLITAVDGNQTGLFVYLPTSDGTAIDEGSNLKPCNELDILKSNITPLTVTIGSQDTHDALTTIVNVQFISSHTGSMLCSSFMHFPHLGPVRDLSIPLGCTPITSDKFSFHLHFQSVPSGVLLPPGTQNGVDIAQCDGPPPNKCSYRDCISVNLIQTSSALTLVLPLCEGTFVVCVLILASLFD